MKRTKREAAAQAGNAHEQIGYTLKVACTRDRNPCREQSTQEADQHNGKLRKEGHQGETEGAINTHTHERFDDGQNHNPCTEHSQEIVSASASPNLARRAGTSPEAGACAAGPSQERCRAAVRHARGVHTARPAVSRSRQTGAHLPRSMESVSNPALDLTDRSRH